MSDNKSRLGKGIGAIIKDNSRLHEDNILNIDITRIEPNKNQPRRNFNDESLEELAESIKKHGILEPILVKKNDEGYEIIAGERRWRAAKKAKIEKVPVIVKKFSEKEILEISLIENLQRENLNPIEEATGYRRLIDEFNLRQEDIAERISKSRASISNSMRLLRLNKEIQDMIVNSSISVGHARCLLAIENDNKQVELARRIVKEGLTVRDIENIVKNLNEPKKQKIIKKDNSFLYKDLENELKSIFGTKVNINSKNNKKGKIEIEYYSVDELERIIDIIKKDL